MRKAKIKRKTRETSVEVTIDLDGTDIDKTLDTSSSGLTSQIKRAFHVDETVFAEGVGELVFHDMGARCSMNDYLLAKQRLRPIISSAKIAYSKSRKAQLSER